MKIFFTARIRAVLSDLQGSGLFHSDTLVMAYFLMTDGAVAYQAHKKNGLPYVVSVRNADINHYLKYRPWLKPLARKILIHAESIVFVSPSYIKALKKELGEDFFNTYVTPKINVIGNIVNELWFSATPAKPLMGKTLNLLYVGEFSKNKRIDLVIQAYDILKVDMDIKLTLVGNYGNYCHKISKLAASRPGVFVVDRIHNTKDLISIVDSHDIFVMPSKTETFGMVYIEAMARGLPVIYTKDQGIDGYFPEGAVGYSVTTPIDKNIVRSVLQILKNYGNMSNNAKTESQSFSISKIIRLYVSLFNSIR
jgi:glycosyltransferase involved in cell wall biosynthesis